MDDKRYLEQWERVERWYSKIEDFSIRPSDTDQIIGLDMVYVFFIFCFHLKDWIYTSCPELKVEVENLFDDKRGVLCLIICAGLANGTKHLVFDKKRPTQGRASVVGQSVNVYIPTLSLDNEENKKKYVRASYRWAVEANGRQYDAYDLARDCMKEWEGYLKSKKLI